VKSFNYTGFSKKKNSETFHVNSASELIHLHWFFEILKKKNSETFDVNSASELTRTGFSKFFLKKNIETFDVNSASELIHSHWFFEI